MFSPELTPIKQAYEEIPERWYERGDLKSLDPLAGMINLFSTLAYVGLFVSGNDSLTYHLIGGGVFIASTVADRISTTFSLNAMNRAAAHGISTEHTETHPLLQDATTSQQFNYHPKTVLVDLLGTSAAFALPNVGVILSIVKFTLSLSNLRIARRYDRATQIAASNPGAN